MKDELDARNAANISAWRKRMASQRGSSFLTVDPYPDLRDQDDMHRWRVIEFKRRQTGRSKKAHAKVVNIAGWYLRRARNGRRSAIA